MKGFNVIDMDKYDKISDFLDEIQEALIQLLSSGFNTSHEYTIDILKNLEKGAESLGLIYAGEKLGVLYEKLNLKRHNFEFDFCSLTEEYCRLNEYCIICRKQLDVIKAEEMLENKNNNLNN